MEKYKLIVIGGGAAGLMAAISASEEWPGNVAILEGNSRCGTKILMSGGSRCNVTNESVRPENFFGGSRNFIKNVLREFSDRDALEFFRRLGVQLKLEPGGKYFPQDDSAASILNALQKKAAELRVKIHLSAKVESIEFNGTAFMLATRNQRFEAERIILTTGGRSYPTTGSDGTGYGLAKKLGHTVKPLFPALTPILLDDPKLTGIPGITIPARLTLFLDEKKLIEHENSLLITHFGISGPAALNISREVARLQGGNLKLKLNFIPLYSEESLRSLLKNQIRLNSEKSVLNFFREMLPVNLCGVLFGLAEVSPEKKFYSLSKEETGSLVRVFTAYELKFTGLKGFSQAEVTAGGVPLEEVRYQTMESRIQKGLYLAGEILDADGFIGGYNFQWAWSTGFIAGRAAAQIEYK
ncbi:MAG: NAD(P)/FAD-dependent oxidoreductase [Ignavibacteria bacterium]|jgi:predicted Rossmann fold flavoprotein|nr:NAD(P)/FAD-dependent oxidoreductase [Ignavibacteria bacterium]MCU7503255.1 NAD(P)/FAD-dependent oxidoreductase [Ignavibacteria bacterium]MCU7515799.1 NAD(P)/FAD-dependent oxidoreductase [Ignavibacteria bacterium]